MTAAVDILAPRPHEPHTRRRTMSAIAATILIGSLAQPSAARSRKSQKRNRHRCKNYGDQCQTAIRTYCAGTMDSQLCETVYLPCCQHFGKCSIGAGITCIYEAD